MGISDPLHAKRHDADRQQSPGARYQNLCHWQKELAVQRHRRGSQGQCRRLQSDADLPRLTRRAVSLVAPRAHRIASARRRRRYHRPAALQLPQNRRCLNGSDAALDTKAIRQKRERHRAEKIALTDYAVTHILWVQGEIDYVRRTNEKDYRDRFMSLVKSLRSR